MKNRKRLGAPSEPFFLRVGTDGAAKKGGRLDWELKRTMQGLLFGCRGAVAWGTAVSYPPENERVAAE